MHEGCSAEGAAVRSAFYDAEVWGGCLWVDVERVCGARRPMPGAVPRGEFENSPLRRTLALCQN